VIFTVISGTFSPPEYLYSLLPNSISKSSSFFYFIKSLGMTLIQWHDMSERLGMLIVNCSLERTCRFRIATLTRGRLLIKIYIFYMEYVSASRKYPNDASRETHPGKRWDLLSRPISAYTRQGTCGVHAPLLTPDSCHGDEKTEKTRNNWFKGNWLTHPPHLYLLPLDRELRYWLQKIKGDNH